MNDARDSLRAWLDLLTASNALKKSVDTALRADFDISISRFDILAALHRAEPQGLRAGALTRRLKVTDGNTTQVTARLLKEGLVKRAVDTQDRRAAIFSLTPKGRRLFEKMAAAHQQWIAEAFVGLSPAEIKSLRELLSQIRLPSDDQEDEKDAA